MNARSVPSVRKKTLVIVNLNFGKKMKLSLLSLLLVLGCADCPTVDLDEFTVNAAAGEDQICVVLDCKVKKCDDHQR